MRSSAASALVLLGLLCRPGWAQGTVPQLDVVDCSSISPTVTAELLAIELKTLRILVTPTMRWAVRCQGQHATVKFQSVPDSPEQVKPETEPGNSDSLMGAVSAEVDLASTDEAAWPRLIAISASELVEQRKRSTLMMAPLASQTRDSKARVQLVALDVKTKRSAQYLTSVGLSVARVGEPGTNLGGLSLGIDRRLGAAGLLSVDLRSQWGKTSMREVNVNWQLVSAAVAGGAALGLGPVELDAMAGMRIGRVALSGEATTSELRGRRVVGTTLGPFVALRLRRALGDHLFLGLAVEEGYCLLPVRGTYDGGAALLTIDGRWTSATFSAGWRL